MAPKEFKAMRRIGALLMIVLLAGAAMVTSGCNTMRGVGQDVSSVGRYVTNSFR